MEEGASMAEPSSSHDSQAPAPANGVDGQPEVILERRDAVAVLTLSHPSALNAMTWFMYEELARRCAELDGDDSVRAVVLQGAGDRAFVAGTDITQFQEFRTGEDGVDYERRLDSHVSALETLRKPTIAKLRGYAVGAGASLALACDLRVATPSLKFGIPIARTLGNCLSSQTLARIVDLVGPSSAKQLLYTAELLDASTCQLLGIVNEVVDENELDARVDALTAQICSHAPLTLAATKQTIARIVADRRPQPNEDIIRAVYGSRDFHEGVEAFVEKRRPQWQGR
jgi:enoyl-CoA hydratase